MPQNKQVLSKIDNFSMYRIENTTFHVSQRKTRLELYDFGHKVDAFLVNTNHKNGYEIHIIDDKGYIQVYNQESKRFITAMSGRPMQIKHYYQKLNIKMSDIMKKAMDSAYQRNETSNAHHM